MQVRFTKTFLKEVDKINNPKLAYSIIDCIEKIKAASDITSITNLKKLIGHKNAFRIRTGEYRIGILIENNTIVFSRFMHRRDIYKYFP